MAIGRDWGLGRTEGRVRWAGWHLPEHRVTEEAKIGHFGRQCSTSHTSTAPDRPLEYRPRPPPRTTQSATAANHLLYDIKQGHLLTVLTTAHEARRLASQMAAAGHDIRRKATHDT